MNFSVHHSTPNQDLNATKQATRESGGSRKFPKAKQRSLWEAQQKPEAQLQHSESRRSPQPNSPTSTAQIAHYQMRKASPQQLTLWDLQQNPEEFAFQKQQKPQISSIPGISPKEHDRYRVVLGREILGERLTLDEALKLANQSTHL
jgi:hypothetical protein